MKKTVCLITGTRAEWGLLRRVAETLRASDTLQLRLIVTGAHLSDAFGRTVREIEAAGFTPDECIDILKFGTAPARPRPSSASRSRTSRAATSRAARRTNSTATA